MSRKVLSRKMLLTEAYLADKLGIHMTPTIVLVDSTGKVLDSWRGALQPDAEREVFAALGLSYKPPAGSTFTAANVKKTAEIFDEQREVLSICFVLPLMRSLSRSVKQCDI